MKKLIAVLFCSVIAFKLFGAVPIPEIQIVSATWDTNVGTMDCRFIASNLTGGQLYTLQGLQYADFYKTQPWANLVHFTVTNENTHALQANSLSDFGVFRIAVGDGHYDDSLQSKAMVEATPEQPKLCSNNSMVARHPLFFHWFDLADEIIMPPPPVQRSVRPHR